MSAEHATDKGSEERPPLGSDEAIDEIKEALLSCRDRGDHGCPWDIWNAPLLGLRENDVDVWPFILHGFGPLHFRPHYLEVIEARRDLGWVRISVTGRRPKPEDLDDPDVEKRRPEDYFQEYVARVRKQEMKQRRRLATRRRGRGH